MRTERANSILGPNARRRRGAWTLRRAVWTWVTMSATAALSLPAAGPDPPASPAAATQPHGGTDQVLRIYLARHGQTDWNASRRLQGGTDVPLNDTGRQQAHALAAKLAGVPLDAVYASGLSRSLETAKIAAGDRAVQSLPLLNEQSLGSFEGKRLDGSDPEAAAEWKRRSANPDDSLDGGESVNQHFARVQQALALLRSRHPSGTILVVGHGGTNALLLRALLGLSEEETAKIHQDNAEVYLIEIGAAGPPIVWKQIPRDRLEDL